jgi:hypothetical protein
MRSLTAELNRLANGGAAYPSPDAFLDTAGAANAWAGTSGLHLQGALNAKNSTSGLGITACLNALAGTTGLGPAAAAAQIAS